MLGVESAGVAGEGDCRSWGPCGTGTMEADWPERHAKASFQSRQGQQVGIGLSGKCSHQGLSANRASACCLVDGQALLVDCGRQLCGNPACVFGGDGSAHCAVGPFTRVQIVDGPRDRADSSGHPYSVLGCVQMRGHVCQVSNRSSNSLTSGITGMWFV
jgi:hypothetical protein